ncbi:hypothetical protein MRX96_021294 [Rhipicephalus microplus]
MDILNSRKRLREESGDEDDHAPPKANGQHLPRRGSTRFTGLSRGVRERVHNRDEFRRGVHHRGHDNICPNRRPGPNELGWCRHSPTPHYRLNGRPTTCNNRISRKPTLRRFSCHGARPPTAVDTTRQHSSVAGSPPDTEGFQVVTTKSARRRARDLAAAAALPVDPAIVGTVLFRPSAPGGTFSGSPRLTLAQALSTRPGVAAIRVNHKRNIVAADATTRECLEQLLNIKELKGIPVTAKEPADHKTSTGFLHGVDGEPAVDSLLPGIKSAVPVLSAAREGRTVTLRFAGPVPPEHVSLFLVRFPVRPARPRPLQCRQCGRFGHVKESCSWPGSCIRCGRTHPGESCKQTRCVNCGGPHTADTPECPRWQEQRKIATIMASSPTVLSRRTVAAAVREEIREARSFASVVKGHPAPPPPPGQTHPGASEISPPATPGTAVHQRCCPYGPASGHYCS